MPVGAGSSFDNHEPPGATAATCGRLRGQPWHRRLALALALVVALATLAGCGQAGSESPATRDEIQSALEIYLPKLAEAYATRDANVLEGLAVPKEIAIIDNFLDQLTDEGRIIKPTFKQVTVEDFNVWNYSNAFVTTLEIWDLHVYTTGAEVKLSESLDQHNRVKYQLKREGETWVVLLRQLEQTLE